MQLRESRNISAKTTRLEGDPLNEIQSAVGKELPGTKVDVKGNGSWTKIGVVVRTDGTHSYMAVAFQIRNLDHK